MRRSILLQKQQRHQDLSDLVAHTKGKKMKPTNFLVATTLVFASQFATANILANFSGVNFSAAGDRDCAAHLEIDEPTNRLFYTFGASRSVKDDSLALGCYDPIYNGTWETVDTFAFTQILQCTGNVCQADHQGSYPGAETEKYRRKVTLLADGNLIVEYFTIVKNKVYPSGVHKLVRNNNIYIHGMKP